MKEFSESVSPITVQTMQMIAGSSQLQFDFVDTDTNAIQDYRGSWNQSTKTYSIPGGRIRHYTFGKEKDLRSDLANVIFDIPETYNKTLSDSESSNPYYLYIVYEPREGDKEDGATRIAEYALLPTAHAYKGGEVYYFQVGILNSENDGDRGFIKMYGFTEITPGRITTDQIVSKDGKSYFNLLQNSMQLENEKTNNRLSWVDGKLEIVGRLKQLGGDNKSYDVGIYRGDYKETSTYYHGDTVTYPVGGEICTYHCTSEDPVKGHEPTESDYWQVVARGSKGDDGERGAPIIFRGEWKETNEYYGNPSRLDIVKLKNKDEYYITKIDSGVVPGTIVPGSETVAEEDKKWSYFGAQFDSIATDFLFSKKAHIGGWSILDDHLISSNDAIVMDGKENCFSLSKRIYLDETGLTLYESETEAEKIQRDNAKVKACIRIKDIDSNEDMGIEAEERTPVFKKRTSNTETLYGIHYSDSTSKPVYLHSGNIWTDYTFSIPKNTKSYFNNLKTGIKFTFNEISYSAYGQGFNPFKIKITPVINGEEFSDSFKYYPDPITLPVSEPYSVSAQLDFGSFVSTVTGIEAKIGFNVTMEDFSGSGTARCYCEFTPTIEKVIFETESDVKTIIAPNGFYCYGGNKNLIWVTPEKVQIKGGGIGPVISSGKYALKVSPDGISKSCNFMDNENLIRWEPVFTEDSQIFSTGNYALKVGSNGLYISKNYLSIPPKWTKLRLIDENNQII